jgi:hypothetical protein
MINPGRIEIGSQAFLAEGGEEFGAVRAIDPLDGSLTVYVENARDYVVPLAAVRSAHDGKVVLDAARLPGSMRRAIRRAHQREEPGV